jgi:hypothetical protein
MQIVFIVTTDSEEIDKPPMATVYAQWSDVIAHFKLQGFGDDIKTFDLFDDIICTNTLCMSRQNSNNKKLTVTVKAATFRGKLNTN